MERGDRINLDGYVVVARIEKFADTEPFGWVIVMHNESSHYLVVETEQDDSPAGRLDSTYDYYRANEDELKDYYTKALVRALGIALHIKREVIITMR